jgi:hypothetical protein
MIIAVSIDAGDATVFAEDVFCCRQNMQPAGQHAPPPPCLNALILVQATGLLGPTRCWGGGGGGAM